MAGFVNVRSTTFSKCCASEHHGAVDRLDSHRRRERLALSALDSRHCDDRDVAEEEQCGDHEEVEGKAECRRVFRRPAVGEVAGCQHVLVQISRKQDRIHDDCQHAWSRFEVKKKHDYGKWMNSEMCYTVGGEYFAKYFVAKFLWTTEPHLSQYEIKCLRWSDRALSTFCLRFFKCLTCSGEISRDSMYMEFQQLSLILFM